MRFVKKIKERFEVKSKSDKFDKMVKEAKVGDILEVEERGKSETLVVVSPSRTTGGFYYAPSDKKGKILPNPHGVFSSNMLLSMTNYKKIGEVKFKIEKFKDYSWTITGDKSVDEHLPNLDERISLFQDLASKKFQDLYDEQEDINYHKENAKMVAEFAKHMASGKKPEQFKWK